MGKKLGCFATCCWQPFPALQPACISGQDGQTGAEKGCCGALDCEQLTPHHVMHLGQLPKLGHCKGYLRQGSLIELDHLVWGYVKRQGW